MALSNHYDEYGSSTVNSLDINRLQSQIDDLAKKIESLTKQLASLSHLVSSFRGQ